MLKYKYIFTCVITKSFRSNCLCLIWSNSFLILSFCSSFGNMPSINFGFCCYFAGYKTFKASTVSSSLTFNCLNFVFETLFNGEYANSVCCINWLWSVGNISSPVRYSYLAIFPDDNVNIFAATLLLLHNRFSSLIFS